MRLTNRIFKYTNIAGSLITWIYFLLSAQAYAQQTAKPRPGMIAHIDSLNDVAVPLIVKDAGKAFNYLTQAELLATEYNYTKGLAESYLYQAEILSQRGYSKRALELYYRSMQLSKKNNDVYNIARAEQYVSTIKREDGSFKEAEKILYRTFDIFKTLNKPMDMVKVQLRLGLLKADQKNYAKALQFFDEAKRLSVKEKYQTGERKSYYNRALVYQSLNKPDSAINNLHKALHMDSLTSDCYGKTLSYIELSRVYIKTHDYKQALAYAALAYTKADSTNALELAKTSLQLLIRISTHNVDKDAIIQWQSDLIYIDSQITERERQESNNFIDALRMQEEQQLKVQRRVLEVTKKSEQQKTLIALYTGFLLVFVVIVFMLGYNYKKAKRYTQELNLRKEKIEHQVLLLDKLNNEIMQTNQQLENDNELKSKLLSILTHDLRKPLANTQSIIHLMNMDMVTLEEAHDLFGQLEAQYTRVIALTDNLLFWIRGQVSGAPVELKPVNVRNVVDVIIEEQKIPANEKRIAIANSVNEELAWLTETETIRIVLRNLFNNAIKFTPDGGRIEVYADTTDVETCVTVKDSGIGITTEVMDRINSENYYTTKGTQNEEGSGFGLMLIRDLLKKHNGKLKISSAPGEGSAFTISFPASTVITDSRFVS